MNTLEKLERLIKERDAMAAMPQRTDKAGQFSVHFWGPQYRDTTFGATLTEAVEEAYEQAFLVKKLEVGDIFTALSRISRARLMGRYRDDGLYDNGPMTGKWDLENILHDSIRVIGKACASYEATV